MEFGKTLRAEREAKGYTIAQIAETTHIMPRAIEGLESEDFSMIVAPIYGRGFVKLYCQALGIDPKPFIEAFMDAYNGERNSNPDPTPAVPPPPPPASAPEPPQRKLPVGAEEVPVPDPQRDLFERPVAEVPPPSKPLSRYAPPTPMDEGRGFPIAMPAVPWRLVGLLAAAIAVVVILILGIRSLYSSLSEPGTPSAAPAAETATSDPAAKTPRTPKPVKPLYID